MYYYIYDQFLSHKKYDKIIAQIEGKITDLGIKDRIIKMSILKSVKELVMDALRKGATTIVAVGNDQTVNKVVNLIVAEPVVFGIIPIGDNNSIAKFLGINNPLSACEIISARKVETINLGEVNSEYFINSIKIHDHKLTLECNDRFKITTLSKENLISIYNFSPGTDMNLKSKKFFNPQDNFLEVVVEPKDKKTLNNFIYSLLKKEKNKLPESVFRVKKISIKNTEQKSGSVVVDDFKVMKTPLNIRVSDKKLKIIVGKERHF